MKYLLIGEKYDRGPGGLLKTQFEAADDTAAKLKLCAMAFGMPQDVKSLVSYDDISTYLLDEILDEDDVESIYDVLEDGADDPEVFTDYILHEIFEPSNGDGMDFFASLTNMSTGETVWDSGDPTDYELEYDDDDEERLF